jgi:Pyridoxamine 5'-phosphate oxidase
MPPVPLASRPSMPGYGIVSETEGEGLLPWSWAEERLAATRNYFLATTRPGDGGPHVMPVWGLWRDDTFQFSTGRTSRKAQNLLANPRCVVCTDDGDESVIVEGAASELETAAHPAFFAAYQAKYGMDVSKMGEPLYVVRPRLVFGQIERSFTKSATRWRFG